MAEDQVVTPARLRQLVAEAEQLASAIDRRQLGC